MFHYTRASSSAAGPPIFGLLGVNLAPETAQSYFHCLSQVYKKKYYVLQVIKEAFTSSSTNLGKRAIKENTLLVMLL